MSTPGALILRTNGTTERMRIDASGNVGIGTSSPSVKLQVNGGTAAITNSTAAVLLNLNDTTTNNIQFGTSGDGFYVSNTANKAIWFATNNSERMRITSTGNVGIGTTSPGQKLTVAGTIESTSGGVKFPDGTTQTTAASGNAIPAGSVMDYAGATAPSGWLLCAGQAVSRSTYADLFTAISTTYGVGDGSTTFNLPDLRGRVAVGKDDMNGTAANRITSGGSGITGTTLGAAGGTQTHTLTTSEMPAHTHGGVLTSSGGTASMFGSCGSSSSGSTGSTGGGGAHQNTQPSMILNKIIKT
jgi:microcystin-dependent protein